MGEQNTKNRSGQVLLSALPFKILYGIKKIFIRIHGVLLKGFKEKRDLRSKFGGRELGKECMIKEDITCNRKQMEQDEDLVE